MMTPGNVPGAAFGAWELPLLDPAAFHQLDPPSGQVLGAAQARYLLGYSLLAPSSHNTVPQAYRLQLERDRIEVWLRREHVLPASDPNGSEAVTSVGCAVESLVIAAEQYGIQCSWLPNAGLDWRDVSPAAQGAETLLGTVLLSVGALPGADARHAALMGLRNRRTVRAEFDGAERLPTALRGELEELATDTVSVSLFESATDKFAWGKLDELAVKHKLEEDAFRRELGQWLLPNSDDQSARGMRGREFGFDDRVTLALSAGLRGDAPLAVDQLAFLARAGRVGICSSSAIGVLSCSDPGVAGAVASGRVFQRCMLLIERHGYSYAVHTAICHVPHARAMSSATLLRSRVPTAIFRVGKPLHPSDAARARSSRPALDELLLGASGR